MIKKNQKGFTLIELLIVMAVLAILAIAVLSAINPVEQLRKAADSRRRADTAELLNGLERYYTTYRRYPWTTAPVKKCPYISGTTSTCTLAAGTDVTGLGTTNELKAEFKNRPLEEYYVSQDTLLNADTIHVCFLPQSKTWSDITVAKFDGDGTPWQTGDPREVCVPE